LTFPGVNWIDSLILVQEKKRQKHFINLIPSENFTSQAVLDALGSVMQSQSAAVGSTRMKLTGPRQIF
jgi:glycine/serine hydroxymethyltransferase